MNDLFAPAPTQSVTLQNENIAPPNSIFLEDLQDPMILGQKRVASRAYLREMKSRKALRQEVVTTADEESGESFVIAAEVAALAPALAVQMPQINMNPFILQVQQLSQQLTQSQNQMQGLMNQIQGLMNQMQGQMNQMQGQMNQMQEQMNQMQGQMNQIQGEMLLVKQLAIQSRNASATKPDHSLHPPPSMVGDAPHIPPPQCPRNLQELFTINVTRLVPVEIYYGLGHEGTVKERRQRVFVEYGFRE